MKTVLPLTMFDYNKKGKYIRISSEYFAGSFPKELIVRSHHTGKVIRFVYDQAAAERQEFWDGEYAEYIPETPIKNVEKAIVIHEF